MQRHSVSFAIEIKIGGVKGVSKHHDIDAAEGSDAEAQEQVTADRPLFGDREARRYSLIC